MLGLRKHYKSIWLWVRNSGLMAVCIASLNGCALVGIPSQRFEQEQCDASCGPANPLPPLPGCFSQWQEQKQLPEAPAYPRFHPLPTRPMFAPVPPH